jgi:hypothetical protein
VKKLKFGLIKHMIFKTSEEVRLRARELYKLNIEKIKERKRKWHFKNREKVLERKKRYRNS